MTRKNLLRKALSGLLILTLAGCHPGKEKTQEKCQTLQIETETEAGSIRLSEVANGSLVVLPTSDSLLLSEINQIHLKKDFLYVADPSAVYKFSLSGECLGTIRRQGTGPEEYANVSDFQTDGEHVWVLSRNTQCINSYSWDNSCTSRINLDLWMENICLTDSNTLYIYTGNDMSKDNLFQLHALSLSDSSSKHHFLPVDKAKAQYLFVKSKNIFQQNGSHTYFTQLFNDTVYNLNAAACTPAFVLDFSGKNIPSSFYNQPYEHIMEFFEKLHQEDRFAYGTDCFLETDKNYWAGYFYKKQYRMSILPKSADGKQICFGTLLVDQLYDYPVNLTDVTLFVQNNGQIVLPLQPDDIMEYGRTHLSPSQQQELADKLHYTDDQNPVLLFIRAI